MRNTGGNARGWQLMGVSPKVLSLMPAQPWRGWQLGDAAEFGAGRNIKGRHTWSRDFRLSLPLVSHRFSSLDSGDSPISALLSTLDRNRLRFLARAGSDTSVDINAEWSLEKRQATSRLAVRRKKNQIGAFAKRSFSIRSFFFSLTPLLLSTIT